MAEGARTLVPSDHSALAALLGVTPSAVLPCAKGGNNRVFRVEAEGAAYLAKWYFESAHDTRNRLENEWAFLTYAARAGVPNVPRPVAKDPACSLAVYTFLEGAVPAPESIDADAVTQAGALIAHLNRERATPKAQALPSASESCFSADDHLSLLRRRLDALTTADALPELAGRFHNLRQQMEATFTQHARAIEAGYAALNLTLTQPLPQAFRCLSPSDFGFHNSLHTPEGKFSFIDFEYAGWDDPAKLLCDFLLHPGISVNGRLLPHFLAPLKAVDINLTSAIDRARLLFPLLALRWCCIILNVFVPQWAARRQFADPAWNKQSAQAEQLDKAQRMLARLHTSPFESVY